jgi:hypothetical protein
MDEPVKCLGCGMDTRHLMGTYEVIWNPGKWTEFYHCDACHHTTQVSVEKYLRPVAPRSTGETESQKSSTEKKISPAYRSRANSV